MVEVDEIVKCSVKQFCTSIAPTLGVQTFQRKLRSIAGMTRVSQCRRVFLNSHFGFTDSTATVQNCCDICENSHPTFDLAAMNSEIDKSALRSALSSYVTSSDLGEEVSLECIEQLVRFPKLYLAEEELTKDFQISSAVAQSLCCIVKQVTDLTLT